MKSKVFLALLIIVFKLNLIAQVTEPIHIAPNVATPITFHSFGSAPELITSSPNVSMTTPILVDKKKGTWSAKIKVNGRVAKPVTFTVIDRDNNTTYAFTNAIVIVKDSAHLKELNNTEDHHGLDTINFTKNGGDNSNIGSIGLNRGANNPPINIVQGAVKPIVGLWIAIGIICLGIMLGLFAFFSRSRTEDKFMAERMFWMAGILITPAIGYLFSHLT